MMQAYGADHRNGRQCGDDRNISAAIRLEVGDPRPQPRGLNANWKIPNFGFQWCACRLKLLENYYLDRRN
jgi:hypothetical protein